MTEFTRSRLYLRLVFALNAIGLALWFPRIPDVKAALDVDLFVLSICFFMLPLGTFAGFFYAPGLLARFGARRIVAVFGALFVLSFILPALAVSPVTLGAALLVCGMAIAPIEVGMNAKASAFEKLHRRRIMTGCHAFWSFGAMAGAVLGGMAGQWGISFFHQQILLAPVLAVAAFWLGMRLDKDNPGVEAGGRHGLALPTRAAVGLSLMPIGALLLEGAMMEWSALFLRDDLGFSSFSAAFVFAVFSVGMGGARLLGDRLAERFGPMVVLRVSSVLAGVGIFTFAVSNGLPLATLGAFLLGTGCANIYPLTVSLIADMPGQSTERNIAALTLTAFTAFLIGPPLIGILGSWFGLGTALLVLTPIAVYPVLQLRRMSVQSTGKA